MGMKKFLLGLVGIVCALFTISAHALPAGYTELEYIESTGTQYINTLLPVKSNTLPEVIYQQTSCSGTGAVFGQVGGSIANLLAYRTHSSDNVFWFARLNPVACDTSKHTVVFNSDGKLYKDSTAIGTRGEFGSGSSLPMLLFAISSDNNTIKYGTVKIFSFKVKEGDTLVANLVPAKYGDTIGMYDTVSGTFFENSGTGTFVAGPIACDGELVTYTSATGTVTQNGTPTPTNPIDPVFFRQGDMVLRKVGDYADTYDATTGKITRRVGVKVFDGSENWVVSSNYLSGMYNIVVDNLYALGQENNISSPYSSHFARTTSWISMDARQGKVMSYKYNSDAVIGLGYDAGANNLSGFKSWLQQQYNAGTPVTVWYPLATEVVEDWPSSYCQQAIKVASTKYVESQFSALNTALANAVATVNTVVTQTIAQAASIATLQSGKQTRPADNAECPAYKQCLLVEDESGTPHWYEITDPFRDFVAPIIANNVAPASTTNQPGYTQLEYIESTGTQYIDTGVIATNWDWSVEFEMSVPQAGDMFFGAGRGIWASTDWGAQFGLANSSGNTNWGAGSGGMKVVVSVLGVRTNTFYKYKITKEGLYVNGELKSQNTATESFSNSDLSLWICKTNNIGTSGYNNSASSWKYVRIYNANNALVFNGIPAKRNSDGAIGMYDTVTKTFFTNAGTGTFTAGPVVANTDVPTNPTWTATWAANATTGVAAGTITGEGLCNGVSGTYGIAATSSQLSNANWNTTGAGCWCKVSGLTVGEEYSAASSSSWVFYYTFGSTAGCAGNCADVCTYAVRSEASFRSAVFGM